MIETRRLRHFVIFIQIISNYFNFFWVFASCFNMVKVLMMSAKLAILDLLNVILKWSLWRYNFCPWRYQQTLSSESSYNVDVIMWPKFGNSSVSMREVAITSIFTNLTEKTKFFEGSTWFNFNNLGLAVYMTLKFVSKGLKLKVRIIIFFLGGGIVFRDSKRKTGRGAFWCSLSLIGLGVLPYMTLCCYISKHCLLFHNLRYFLYSWVCSSFSLPELMFLIRLSYQLQKHYPFPYGFLNILQCSYKIKYQ